MTIEFRFKDSLLKECEVEVKGVHPAEEVMELVDLHAREAHNIVKVSPETREKIGRSLK